jgi:hypothetical protein
VDDGVEVSSLSCGRDCFDVGVGDKGVKRGGIIRSSLGDQVGSVSSTRCGDNTIGAGSSNSKQCTVFSGNCVAPFETILPRGKEYFAYMYEGAGLGIDGRCCPD